MQLITDSHNSGSVYTDSINQYSIRYISINSGKRLTQKETDLDQDAIDTLIKSASFGNVNLILLVFLTFITCSIGYVRYHKLNVHDIGLGALSLIKMIRGEVVELNQLNQPQKPSVDHGDWTILLQRHVSSDGQVNYKGFQDDRVELQRYLDKLSENLPGSNWSKEEQLAYWINAYNAFTIRLILDHYPLQSIKDISDGLPMINSPWDIKFFSIGGIRFDLNTIEHQILRRRFQEPRIHFAINCASVSCPQLRDEAYTASILEIQLEEQAHEFINDSNKNIITSTKTELSAIFNWFQSDFIHKSDLLTYLKIYKPSLNTENQVTYMEYNWRLNE